MSGTPIKLGDPVKVGKTTFVGIAWGSVGVSLLFLIFRIVVRLRVFGRLHADDALVLFACVVLLINSIIWEVGVDAMYENVELAAGQLHIIPPNFPHRTEQYLRRSVVVIVFFYTGLWSIKLSFLLFFRRLGQNVRNQAIIWWVVLAITIASYFACVGTIEYHCLVSSFNYISAHCAQAPGPIRFQRLTLRANMILDVVTDALIILVPVNLLWKVRLSLRKKMALGGIFSITVFIMLFAIVRVVVVSSYSHQPDQTWLYMWSNIEQAVSIMVACIASFPSLFKKSERDKRQKPTGNQTSAPLADRLRVWLALGRDRGSANGSNKELVPRYVQPEGSGPTGQHITKTVEFWSEYPTSSAKSSERMVPMDAPGHEIV